MYSPADFPSSTRAAPAKKRTLSEQIGISSRAYDSGLPTLRDSISASSSACSSSTSASFSRSSARSAGVESSHAGSAAFAAATARSTSAASQRGTSAMTSSVAGFRTSIVSPEAASAHAPPTKIWCRVPVVLISCPPSSLSAQDARFVGQPLGDHHRDDGQQDHDECDHVDDRKLLALPQVVEDEDRQRGLRAGRERRDDHLVEREREREQPAGDERGREHRPC